MIAHILCSKRGRKYSLCITIHAEDEDGVPDSSIMQEFDLEKLLSISKAVRLIL